MEPRRQGFYLFVGIFLLYLSLSPLTTQATGYQFSMGYQCTNTWAAEYIAAKIAHTLPYQRPTNCSLPFWLPVNGLLEPVLETPLILPTLPLGELWSERIASLEPILLSSLLVWIVFIWTRQIAPSWAFPLTLTFALATIVWPYAYLGMEPAQSLFLLLSAYLALGWKRPRRWWTATAFAISCALAISLKSSGIVLTPAIGFLVYSYVHADRKNGTRVSRSYLLGSAALAFCGAALYVFSAYSRSFHPAWQAGLFATRGRTVGPIAALLNAISLFTSLNKGLFVYCPVTILCLLAMVSSWRSQRSVAIFACLALIGQVAAASAMYFWTDESWGPRYLHCAIGPLFIVLATAKAAQPPTLRTVLPTALLFLWGLCVSTLGVLVPYSTLVAVATDTGSPISIEQLQYDVRWNPIRLDLNVLKQRVLPDREIYWPPVEHSDLWLPLSPQHPVSLRPHTAFQPYLLNSEHVGSPLWFLCVVAGVGGVLFLQVVVMGSSGFSRAPVG